LALNGMPLSKHSNTRCIRIQWH